ncbi:hypothetical protein ACIGZJ_32945 [Kitasatospora sp. NPDC052868]|uniref:hypothetical protein n=1 Tax=Kitasatospora sp. NPDC052868 TaxID=3364060 RepID=UPI0037C8F2EC
MARAKALNDPTARHAGPDVISDALSRTLSLPEIELLTAWLYDVPTHQLATDLGATQDSTEVILANALAKLGRSPQAKALLDEHLAGEGPKHSGTLRLTAARLGVDSVPRCPTCATALLSAAPTGRPRRYCSDRCRQKAYRERARAGAKAAPAPGRPTRDVELRLRDPWSETPALRWYYDGEEDLLGAEEAERLLEWEAFGRRKDPRRGFPRRAPHYRPTLGALAMVERVSPDRHAREASRELGYEYFLDAWGFPSADFTALWDTFQVPDAAPDRAWAVYAMLVHWHYPEDPPQGGLQVLPIAGSPRVSGDWARVLLANPVRTHLPEHSVHIRGLGRCADQESWITLLDSPFAGLVLSGPAGTP